MVVLETTGLLPDKHNRINTKLYVKEKSRNRLLFEHNKIFYSQHALNEENPNIKIIYPSPEDGSFSAEYVRRFREMIESDASTKKKKTEASHLLKYWKKDMGDSAAHNILKNLRPAADEALFYFSSDGASNVIANHCNPYQVVNILDFNGLMRALNKNDILGYMGISPELDCGDLKEYTRDYHMDQLGVSRVPRNGFIDSKSPEFNLTDNPFHKSLKGLSQELEEAFLERITSYGETKTEQNRVEKFYKKWTASYPSRKEQTYADPVEHSLPYGEYIKAASQPVSVSLAGR